MLVRSILAFGSNFEHSGVSITWVIPFKTRLNWDIPVYPRTQVILLTCAGISRHIPSCTKLSPREISQDIPGYPKTRFLYWDIVVGIGAATTGLLVAHGN